MSCTPYELALLTDTGLDDHEDARAHLTDEQWEEHCERVVMLALNPDDSE